MMSTVMFARKRRSFAKQCDYRATAAALPKAPSPSDPSERSAMRWPLIIRLLLPPVDRRSIGDRYPSARARDWIAAAFRAAASSRDFSDLPWIRISPSWLLLDRGDLRRSPTGRQLSVNREHRRIALAAL